MLCPCSLPSAQAHVAFLTITDKISGDFHFQYGRVSIRLTYLIRKQRTARPRVLAALPRTSDAEPGAQPRLRPCLCVGWGGTELRGAPCGKRSAAPSRPSEPAKKQQSDN